MSKRKRIINGFINHLFGMYNTRRIPIYVHWGYKSCVDPSGKAAFGVYCYDDNGDNPRIHVAGEIGTTSIVSCIAHEFVHHMQRINGRDMNDIEVIERDAEYWGAGLMGQWLINKKKRGEHCYGVARVWESKPKEG